MVSSKSFVRYNAILIALIFIFGCFVSCSNGVLYTENVEYYNADEYLINQPIFLDTIPSNANVVSFIYYDYWQEAGDIYLELTFNTTEEIDVYVSDLKEKCARDLENKIKPTNVDWLVEEQNPYSSGYVDLVCTLYTLSTAYEEKAGYTIKLHDNEYWNYCALGIISYSYEDLTVIQSYAHGVFVESKHHYTPKYFERFNIPIDEPHERVVYVERNDT